MRGGILSPLRSAGDGDRLSGADHVLEQGIGARAHASYAEFLFHLGQCGKVTGLASRSWGVCIGVVDGP